MPSSSTLMMVGGLVLFAGFVLSIAGYLKYSEFVAAVNRVDPRLADELTYENTDGISEKNTRINEYLWNREYLAQNDENLTRLGDQCRRCALPAVLCCFIGLGLLAISLSHK